MFDLAAARRMMVDGQVRTSDVTDQRIIAAMLDLPRERFVPARDASLAYLDRDVAVTAGTPPRRLLKPMVLAKLIQAAEVGPAIDHRHLATGCRGPLRDREAEEPGADDEKIHAVVRFRETGCRRHGDAAGRRPHRAGAVYRDALGRP